MNIELMQKAREHAVAAFQMACQANGFPGIEADVLPLMTDLHRTLDHIGQRRREVAPAEPAAAPAAAPASPLQHEMNARLASVVDQDRIP